MSDDVRPEPGTKAAPGWLSITNLRRLGRGALHALRYELAIYRALGRWIAHRPDVPAGSAPVGYARMIAPVMWLWILASAAEVPAAHFLLPWESARTVLLVIGIWGLAWMLGLMASFYVRPHLVSKTSLSVRSGPLLTVPVSWAEVASVRATEADVDGTIRALQVVDGTLHVQVGGRTNVRLELRQPREVANHRGTHQVTAIAFWVDEPRDVARLVQEHLNPVT